jgi:hypothetical protein
LREKKREMEKKRLSFREKHCRGEVDSNKQEQIGGTEKALLVNRVRVHGFVRM